MTKVLIAPVTVTPTKALTPSHLKGLLWVDVMYRATALVADTTYRYSNTTYNVTAQTLGFWEYLDRTHGDINYSTHPEEEIGKLYVSYQAEPERAPFAALRPYLEAVENAGWVHPASSRLLEVWTGYFARLGMHDPGLTRTQPPSMGLEEMVEHLAIRNLCLDNRPTGGPVYLDATKYGIPLRQIVTREDQPNYLAAALRELIPLIEHYDETVLVHDQELTPDYILLQRVLDTLGGTTLRVAVDRVPIDGVITSSRHGDWLGHTLPEMFAACQDIEPEVLKLGMRLYFIAVLGKGSSQSYREDLLHQSMLRAEKLMARDSPRMTSDQLAQYICQHRGDCQHVDPYRLTSAMLGKHRLVPVHDLVTGVYR
jgi:hypothetical protein